ncbi:bifunctional DNA primase/polymerase [Archaeoglobus profundus]|uniref:Bifunctional DNA primase/polymerase n=1 Tax=Archaeoglobus profundus (strain DSM 5631 / JCM 9629 / NBRC 100127 / Av18) TaxID=572546 RepID=D2REW5_ARCPA|nr:bifunctional DNA primase/polymerase [Archaeoglobus profundus]ADB58659.1 Bifunctional DNA primase/polymerase [Archaeoglobus profundus DSM 5631]
MADLFEWAKHYLEQGFSVIPVIIVPPSENNPKGNKISAVEWKEFQQRRPTLEELEKWFKHPDFPALRKGNKLGLAIVTGEISGNLTVVDFDSREVMSEVLAELADKHPDLYGKILDTWIVETGKGFHYYLKVKNPDPNKFTNRIGIRPGVDIRANGGYVVAPPSPHPSGKVYRFVHKPEEIAELTWEEYQTLLSFLEGKKRTIPRVEVKDGEGRELEESKIVEIVNILRPIYKVGYRDLVVFSLTGWLKKAGVSYNSARKIVELLAEKDEELNLRLYVLDRTYGLRGNPPTEEELKGKAGLQEIAETLLGEERALDLIRNLEEILGKSSPFKDSIFSLIDFRKKAYYVANPKRGIIARAFEDKSGGIVYEKIVAEICPVKVVVYEDPLGGLTKFEIEFHGFRNLTIGPAELDVVISRLQSEGVVKHSRLLRDALSSIISAFIRKGKAEIRRELEKPGFYYINGQIKAVKWQPEEFSKEDLAKALKLLDELRTKWYSKAGKRFTTMIKWGLIAPFAYAIKQIRGTIAVHFPDLVAYGARNTGKTTIGAQIILSIWNPPEEGRIVRGSGDADTKAKHGRLRSLTTFPVVVNEVEGIFNNKELLEEYKSAVENRFVRGKHSHGVYIEFPSLAPFFMTMNGQLPLDGTGAVRKRFFGIHFSLSDEIPQHEIEKFTEEVLPRLGDLRFLGSFIFKKISENPERLKEAWQVLATELLREAFEFAELDVPEWVNEFYEGETEEEVNETINEEIRARLLESINNLYARYISRIEIVGENQNDLYTSTTLERRLKALLQEGFVPWAFLRGEDVVITSAVMRILKDTGIDSLKSLAERFGWKYGVHRVNGRNCKSIKVSFSGFVRFLSGDYEDRSNSESESPDNPKDDQDNSDDTDVSDFSVESAMGLRKKEEDAWNEFVESVTKEDAKEDNEEGHEGKEHEEQDEEQDKSVKKDSTDDDQSLRESVNQDTTKDEEYSDIDNKILQIYNDFKKSVPSDLLPSAFIKAVRKEFGSVQAVRERVEYLVESGKLPKAVLDVEETIKVRAIDYVHIIVNGREYKADTGQVLEIPLSDYESLHPEVKGFLIPVDSNSEEEFEIDSEFDIGIDEGEVKEVDSP